MFDNNPIPVVPKHTNPKVVTKCNPDPYMIEHEGVYYCYSTGWHGVNVMRSHDLKEFEHMGFALEDPECKGYWAPSVIYYDGMFYMYYSCITKGETDAHKEFLRVATSKSPLGPFTCQKVFFDHFSIDPHVFEKDGSLYLVHTEIRDGERLGVCVLLDKMHDPLTPAGNPRVVIRPTIDQEVFEKNRFGDGRDWYTIEGGFYFEQDGIGYLMYSANAWTHGDYFVGYATCDATVPLEEAVFEKYPSDKEYRPLIGKDEYFTGCGHNSMIKGPDGDWLIVYHGRPRNEVVEEGSGDDGRRLCISRIVVDGKKLTVAKR